MTKTFNKIDYLRLLFFLSLPHLIPFVQADSAVRKYSSDFLELAGEYKGEIRLQNMEGTLDRTLASNVKLVLDVKNNQLILKTPTDFTGEGCQSEVGGIRELIKQPNQEAKEGEILRAVFDYHFQKCSSKKQWNKILMFLKKDLKGNFTLETLLTRESINLGNGRLPLKELNVHGIFTKT